MFTLRHAFPGQNDDEPVFIFVRAHPLAFLPYLLICIVMAIVAGILFFGTFAISSEVSPLVYNIALAASGIFTLFVIVFAMIAFIDFYFDIQIVTDRRIIDVSQNRLFNRHLAELNLEDVEDVAVQVSGAFPTLFNFGDVLIQTAGNKMNFHFIHIPKPREIGAIISDLAEQAKRGENNNRRLPKGPIKAVIGNQAVGDLTGLIRLGVHLPPAPADSTNPLPDVPPAPHHRR